MFRVALDRCAAVFDRADYLFTLTWLSVLDRLAGPMPENPANPPGENWARHPQPPSGADEHDLSTLTGTDGSGSSIEAAENPLAAE